MGQAAKARRDRADRRSLLTALATGPVAARCNAAQAYLDAWADRTVLPRFVGRKMTPELLVAIEERAMEVLRREKLDLDDVAVRAIPRGKLVELEALPAILKRPRAEA